MGNRVSNKSGAVHTALNHLARYLFVPYLSHALSEALGVFHAVEIFVPISDINSSVYDLPS